MSELTTTSSQGQDLVDWVPAHIVLVGKKATERKLSIVPDMHPAAKAYLATKKGTVGQAIRDTMTQDGEVAIAKSLMMGNFRPLAQVIAVITGKNITIADRRDYEALPWHFQHELTNLKNDGYTTDGTKPSAARKAIMEVLGMLSNVKAQTESMLAQRRAKLAAQQQPEQPQGEEQPAETEQPATAE